MLIDREEPQMTGLDRKGVRTDDAGNSAPSWQDYIDALKVEGLRYRPASLSKALAERERAGGNPRTSEKDGK
jgi:hypothetical protein